MKKERALLAVLAVAYVVIVVFSFAIGQYHISFVDVIKVLFSRVLPLSRTWNETVEVVIFQSRLPRILASMLVGGALSIGGASFQGIFYNPLVEPYILGVSAGAGFGAALAILLGQSMIVTQLSAFAFGLLCVFLSLWVAGARKTTRRSRSHITLVLSGFIVSSIFSSFVSIVKFVADPHSKLPSIVFWLMGSFAATSYKAIAVSAPVIIAGSLLLVLLRWRINILAMGDDEARTLGENPERLRLAVVLITTLIAASSVSLSGIIGWVGLVVPHIARMLFGSDHRKLIPGSLFLGSAYLLLIDDISRTVATAELPIGVVTALVGAPVFALLLRKERSTWV